MALKLITPAGSLPVSITTALRHVRALQGDADLVNLYIRAATQAVEDYTGRCLIRQTWLLQLDRWPQFQSPSDVLGGGITRPDKATDSKRVVKLERSPLVAIDSVKYWPSDGSAQVTVDAGNYAVDVASLPGRLCFNNAFELPQTAVRFDAIEVQFQAGHGVRESEIPPMLVVAVVLLSRHIFDNPSAVDADGKLQTMPLSYQHIVRALRV